MSPCWAHVARSNGGTCATTLIPMGAMGKALKSYGPCMASHEEVPDGAALSKLSVSSICALYLGHKFAGQFGSTPACVEMLWSHLFLWLSLTCCDDVATLE